MNHLSKSQSVVSWLLQLAVAGILLQTLFFKFTGAEESVYIFRTVGRFINIAGLEPWGRIGSGVVELIASLLLIAPATASMGAVLTMGVMAGAILSHLVVLGIEVKGDGGLLFGLALTAFIGSALVLVWRQMCTAHVSPPMSRGQSESTSDTASITSRPYSMPMRRPRCPTIAVSAEPRSRPIRRRPCGRYSN